MALNWSTRLVATASAVTLMASLAFGQDTDAAHLKWAPTPPMGWNSWDAFGTTINEEQAKAQAVAMAERLRPAGWNVFTVDIQWYQPSAQGHVYVEGAKLAMDEFSRLLPALEKFPSAAKGAGFKPLADFVHGQGLKFGIHLMRGIPRQAVKMNTVIKGTTARARDIALINSTCAWNPDMYGVDVSKPAGQAYYDSLFEMYAAWGVDFVKVDDIARSYDTVQQAEIEAIRKAIDKTGRPIVLSLSPGDTPPERGDHVNRFANMWRISDDFWDQWAPLHGMFGRLDTWSKYRRVGAWPDADMLPFGRVEFGRPTRFTPDEQRLCMTLWCIARSPLILGADMTKLDPFTLELLTNPEVLAVNQVSTNNRQVSRTDDTVVWAADVPNSRDRYVALFNTATVGFPYDLSVPQYRSSKIGGQPGKNVAQVKISVAGAKKLVLVVTDGGNGFEYDHADWIEPTLSGPAGKIKLTQLHWKIAKTGLGDPRINKTIDDTSIMFEGKKADGIGTHSISYIEYDLPRGYDSFTTSGVLSAGSDGKGSVEFLVLVDPVQPTLPNYAPITVPLAALGIRGPAKVRDLWLRQDMGELRDKITLNVPNHGAGFYRVSPE